MPYLLPAAYATGIILALFLSPGSPTGYLLFLLVLGCAAFLCHRRGRGLIVLSAALCLTGFLYTHQCLSPPQTINDINYHHSSGYRLIEARIEAIEHRSSAGPRILCNALSIDSGNSDRQSVTGKILLTVREGVTHAEPGQVIRWRAKLRRPSRFGNPGEFNYPLYLAARNIFVTSYLDNTNHLVVITNHKETRNTLFAGTRDTLANLINAAVPQQHSGLLHSLLLGMKSSLYPEQRRTIADSGIAHLFAISGLHFGLLALLLYGVTKWLYTRSIRLVLWCPPQKILPLVLLIPLAMYLVLTGLAWATCRAFLTVAVAAVFLTANRRFVPFHLLVTVAFILLIINPLALTQPGFQLSFAGVLGLLVWLPRWQEKLRHNNLLIRRITTIFLSTAAATLATLPLTLWHFHQFSPAALMTNFIAIPLIAWAAIPIGLIGLLFHPLVTLPAESLLQLSGFLASLAIDISAYISSFPSLQPVFHVMTGQKAALIAGVLFLCIPMKGGRHDRTIRGAIIMLTLIIIFWTRPEAKTFQVTALSVGQGDATVISLHDKHYLVDGGGLPRSSIDPGRALIAPALGRLGIDSLEGVVLTHNHPDHSSGLTFIINHFPVKIFYYAGDINSLAPELHQALIHSKVKTHQLQEGWEKISTSDSDQNSLNLYTPRQVTKDINDRSIFVYAGNHSGGVLLTADAGRPGLTQLIRNGTPGKVSLLKIPHHGSRHSNPKGYLEHFKPDLCFVSAGINNRFGFPHSQTIAAIRENHTRFFRTDRNGMIKFRFEHGDWHPASEKTGPHTVIR